MLHFSEPRLEREQPQLITEVGGPGEMKRMMG
jgi:hypothetical protein